MTKPNRTIDAVLFDIDGTLVRTPLSYIHTLVLETLLTLGREDSFGVTKKQAATFWYEQDRDSFIAAYFDVDPDVFWDAFRARDLPQKRAAVITLYSDVSFLHALHKQGYKLGVVTNAPAAPASVTISLVGAHLFHACIVGNNGFAEKPSPAGINECLRQIGASPERSMYIGNSAEDVLAAKAAGVRDVIIDRNEYHWNGIRPTRTIHSLYELSDELET